MFINSNVNALVPPSFGTTPADVDKSRFIAQGELSKQALETEDGATISFKAQSPKDAWNEFVTSTSGSMVELSSTITAGFQDVVEKLSSILAENDLESVTGMSIKYAIPETEDELNPEEIKGPEFIVEGVQNEAHKEQIEAILNSEEFAGFKEYFIGLDKLTALQNTSIASQRDALLGSNTADKSTGSMPSSKYVQDFSLLFMEGNWNIDIKLEEVELPKMEKIAEILLN